MMIQIEEYSGYRKTLDKIRLRHYWPKMSKYIEKYCKSCMDCQTKDNKNKLPAGLLKPIPVRGPFTRVRFNYAIRLTCDSTESSCFSSRSFTTVYVNDSSDQMCYKEYVGPKLVIYDE
jgi:hypothetical protein